MLLDEAMWKLVKIAREQMANEREREKENLIQDPCIGQRNSKNNGKFQFLHWKIGKIIVLEKRAEKLKAAKYLMF